MFRFRLEVAGTVEMDRGIARFADGVSDYRPIWPVIEDDFYAQMKAQFASEGAEGGERWQPLSPEYAGWKQAHYPGKPILERTGNLLRSLTSGADPNAVKVEDPQALTLGSKIPYAIYHQTGTSKMPARPEIKLPEPFKRSVMHHIQVYLVQIATQSGFRQGLTPLTAAKLGAIFGVGIPPRGASPRFIGGELRF